jgi:hypothetical protein
MYCLRAALAATCFALALVGTTQNVLNDSTAAVIAYWEPGDQRSYFVERQRSGERTGNSSYTMALKVLDATDSTYVVECHFRQVAVEADMPEDPRQRAVFHRLLHVQEGMRVVFSTDETGIPLALVNGSELEEHGRMVLDGILAQAGHAGERQQMESALADVLSEETLAQDALEDIGNILYPFGVAYITGRVEKVEAEVPNPLGGIPFRTRQQFTMTALDTTKATARMRMVQHIDPKAVDDDIDELIESSGGGALEGDDRERFRRLIEGLRVDESMDIDVELNGAWTTRLVFVRETEVKGKRSTDRRIYTLRESSITPPAGQ